MADEEEENKGGDEGLDPELMRSLLDASSGGDKKKDEKKMDKGGDEDKDDDKKEDGKPSADDIAAAVADRLDEKAANRHMNDGWSPDVEPEVGDEPSEREQRQWKRLSEEFGELVARRRKHEEALSEDQLRATMQALGKVGLNSIIDSKDEKNPTIEVDLPNGKLRIDKVGIHGSAIPTDHEIAAMMDVITATPQVWEGHCSVNLDLPDPVLYKMWQAARAKQPMIIIDNLPEAMKERFRRKAEAEPAQTSPGKAPKATPAADGGGSRVKRRRPLLPPKRDAVGLKDYLKGLQQGASERNAHMAGIANHHEAAIDALRLAMADAARLADAHQRQLAIVAAGAAFIAAQRAFRQKGKIAEASVQGVKLKGATAQQRADTVVEHIGPVVQRQERAARYYHAMATKFVRSVGPLGHSTDPAVDSAAVQKAFDSLTGQHAAFFQDATKGVQARRNADAERMRPFVEASAQADPSQADPSRTDTTGRRRGFGRGRGLGR